jgi:hypothetical protein
MPKINMWARLISRLRLYIEEGESTESYTFTPVWDILLLLGQLRFKEIRLFGFTSHSKDEAMKQSTCPSSQAIWSLTGIEPTMFGSRARHFTTTTPPVWAHQLWLNVCIAHMHFNALENKCSDARSKFLIIWLTDKATIPMERSKLMKIDTKLVSTCTCTHVT